MTITWTEAFSSFSPAGTGWQNYDIYTNKSVPKGAVAVIIIGSVNNAAARTVGLRTDGSSLVRYIKLHEGEGGGTTCATFPVVVHATTGLIETYCSSATGITFYLIGWWTGISYTERFDTITCSYLDQAWHDYDIYTNFSIPKSSVLSVSCANYEDAAAPRMGVQTNGSAVNRWLTIHEAESGTVEYTDVDVVMMHVKADADGIIEYYDSSTGTAAYHKYHITGYYGLEVDYTEGYEEIGITQASTWTDYDTTTFAGGDEKVIEIACRHATVAAEQNCGSRIYGSSLARYILMHEGEDGIGTGETFITGTDANGVLQVYCGTSSDERFALLGYFGTRIRSASDSLGLTESLLSNKTLPIAQTLTLSETSQYTNKTLPINETITLSDAIYKSRLLLLTEEFSVCDSLEIYISAAEAVYKTIEDNLYLSDLILTLKTLPLSDGLSIGDSLYKTRYLAALLDSLTLTDSDLVHKTLNIPGVLSLSDLPWANKTLPISDNLNLTDIILRHKTIPFSDSLTLADIILGHKNLPVNDALGLSETFILTHRKIPILGTFNLSDNILRNRTIVFSDNLAYSDIANILSVTKCITDEMAICDSMEIYISLEGIYVNLMDSIGFVDEIRTNKSVYIPATLSFSDTIFRNRPGIIIADSLGFSESILRHRFGLSVIDSFSTYDNIILNAHKNLIDSIEITDGIPKTNKTLPLIDYLYLTDSLETLITRFKSLIDSLSITDSPLTHRGLIVRDTVILEEIIYRNKVLSFLDSLSISDTIKYAGPIYTAIDISDSFGLTDIFAIRKRLLLNDLITMSEDETDWAVYRTDQRWKLLRYLEDLKKKEKLK
jgi:hypothetical protein